MPTKEQLQDTFLSQLKKEGVLVSIFLVNGIKLHGTVDDYDDQVIFLKSTTTQMIFKHAVSTVVPGRPA